MPSPKDLVVLSTHVKAPPVGAKMLGEVDPQELVSVTVRIRSHTPLQELQKTVQSLAARPPSQRKHLTRKQFAEKHGARDVDIDKAEEFARENGLTVISSNNAQRSVHLQGTAEAMSRAFGVSMKKYQHKGQTFRVRTEPVKVPKELTAIIEAVIGFDTRPQARPHFRIAKAVTPAVSAHAAGTSFTPLQVAEIYDFPTEADGDGQVIGIIELTAPDGSGFRLQELQQYFTSLGVPTPEIVTVSVDGATNQPGTDPSDPQCADGEVMLDIEVAGAIAPKAKIVVYFGPNTPQGFLDVINHAVHDSDNNPTVISLSWGGAEDPNDSTIDPINQILQAAAVMGVTFCVASGDSGSHDNPNDPTHAAVDFPASSPYALGCGGTQLKVSGDTILSEVVWHDADGSGSGGGVSRLFDLPDYQTNAGVPPAKNPEGPVRRGVPDVAGDGASASGYKILVDGSSMTVWGTSAVAPLWAGLVARLNQQVGHSVGYLNSFLYAHPQVFHDITQGNNGDYSAGRGWDPCTGLGSPDGSKLLNVLNTPAVATAGS
jgi:kumamolisin